MLGALIQDLNKVANPQKAAILAGYFKTGKGEYGYGDIFLGIMVPKQREIAKKYEYLSLKDIQTLLNSKYHEYRFTSLVILTKKYVKSDEINKAKIIKLFLNNVQKGNINNWDLVDVSAPRILGDYLFVKDKKILYNLAKSKSLWARRTAVLATLNFIKKEKYIDTLNISKILITDQEDLIHKAVGWMLREVGKMNLNTEIKFLNKFSKVMPRTMLRYAIEKLNKNDQAKYLQS